MWGVVAAGPSRFPRGQKPLTAGLRGVGGVLVLETEREAYTDVEVIPLAAFLSGRCVKRLSALSVWLVTARGFEKPSYFKM